MTAALFEALRGIPRLAGAACVGLSDAFDPAHQDEDTADTRYRHTVALRLCNECPALTDCSKWVATLRPSQKPPGVIAGRINTPPKPKRKKANP